MLNEKVRLLFSATAVEAEIQVELDRVDTCESIREMARFVKDSPCIVVVGVWRRHQDYVRTSSYSLQLQLSGDLCRGVAYVCSSYFVPSVPFVWLKST